MSTNESKLKPLLEKRIAEDKIDQMVGEMMVLLSQIRSTGTTAMLSSLDFEELYATVKQLRSDFY